MYGDQWYYEKIFEILPGDIMKRVIDDVTISRLDAPWDLAWWIPTNKGTFR